MPEIPLFNGGQTVKTGDIPQMPLNNQRMPRADFRGIVSGLGQVAQAQGLMAEASEQPTLDKDMFAGLDKGYQALAAGIKDLGQVAQRYAEKRQEVINDRDIGVEENSLEGVIAEARLGRNPARPETWNTDLSARMGAWKKALDANPNYSRHVKEAMTQKFNQRMQLEVSQTAASSSEAVFRQAGDVQLQRAERYAAEGNLSKAKEILVGANANRYITTDQATARAEEAKSISDAHHARQQAESNPVAVVKALSGGGDLKTPQAGTSWMHGLAEMSGFVKQQILLDAQKKVEQLQTETVAGALAAMADGRIKSSAQLKAESYKYNTNRVLDDTQMEKLGALVDGRNPTEEEVNLVWRKIFEQDGVEDADGIGRERLRREILLSGPAHSKEMLGVFEVVRGDNKMNVGALRTGLDKIHDAHVAGRLGVRHDGEAFLAEAIQDREKLAPFGLDGMDEVLKNITSPRERLNFFYDVLSSNQLSARTRGKKGAIVDDEALKRLDPFTQDLLKNVADGKRGRDLRVQKNVDDSARRERGMMNLLYRWVSSSTSPIDNGAIDKWMSGQVEGYGRSEAGDTLMRRR